MKLNLSIALLLPLLFFVSTAAAQKSSATKPVVTTTEASSFRSSPAYAELLLRKTELQSEMESLVIEYTEEYPKVKEIRYVLALIERDTARLGNVKPSESQKLTLALGKLMLRKIELESDLWKLRRTYQDEHPDVKQARRRVEIFENAIAEVLN